jgi:hypothetical protein
LVVPVVLALPPLNVSSEVLFELKVTVCPPIGFPLISVSVADKRSVAVPLAGKLEVLSLTVKSAAVPAPTVRAVLPVGPPVTVPVIVTSAATTPAVTVTVAKPLLLVVAVTELLVPTDAALGLLEENVTCAPFIGLLLASTTLAVIVVVSPLPAVKDPLLLVNVTLCEAVAVTDRGIGLELMPPWVYVT